ncbi:hypothetical protein ACRRTK_003986 [Alexandromys fortis]
MSISSRGARLPKDWTRQLCRSSASVLPRPPPRLQTDPQGRAGRLGNAGRDTSTRTQGHARRHPPHGSRPADTRPPNRRPARRQPNRRPGPTNTGGEERSARPAGHASRSGGAGQAASRGDEAGGPEARARRGARTASRRGLAPFRVEGADGLTPHPERGASSQPRLDCTIGRCRRDCSPPPLPSVPPPPGSAVGWPRPGAETQKELGAILGGTKQRRNTLPGEGILRTLVYPVLLIL